MDKHVQFLRERNGQTFSTLYDDKYKTSMVQLSRQENYTDQTKILELNIYVFGVNQMQSSPDALLKIQSMQKEMNKSSFGSA